MKKIKKYFYRFLKGILGDDLLNEFRFIKKLYHLSFFEAKPSKMLIYSMDGEYFSNGFADRLRGIISSYAYAKANSIPFKINHKIPFKLEQFFQPNMIDWRISDNELNHNILFANPVIMMDYSSGKRLFLMLKNRQHHIYSNINAIALINQHYNKSYQYSDLFQELFKPSDILSNEVKKFKSFLNEGYISISFRFMQLMGDFKDVRGCILSETEQNILINKCISLINQLHQNHLDIPYILVTTDSIKFLEEARKLNYVFTIPGKIGHIGYNSDKDVQMKTMLDFYMISQAKKAYLGCSGNMYMSNFAKSAALTTNIPYEEIIF